MAKIAELKADFDRLIEKNRLAQAYVIFGSGGQAEKKILAEGVAKKLEKKDGNEGVPLIDAQTFDGRSIGIDAAREIVSFLWRTPVIASRRTVIVENADLLSPLTMNALLKIVEEPPKSSLIFMIVKDPAALLPALTSRLQGIFVSPNPKESEDGLTKEVTGFLKASTKERVEKIKLIIDDDEAIDNLITGILQYLKKDLRKNYLAVRTILGGLTRIRRYNVNKRLQLETALLYI